MANSVESLSLYDDLSDHAKAQLLTLDPSQKSSSFIHYPQVHFVRRISGRPGDSVSVERGGDAEPEGGGHGARRGQDTGA